jgi:Zn-dependent protease
VGRWRYPELGRGDGDPFFVSLLLHELAHSIVASSNGLPVKEITLFALGGVSQIEKNPTSARLHPSMCQSRNSAKEAIR